MVWTVKHVVGDAIAISFVGFVLGPFYPIIMNVLVAILPVEITGGAIGACEGSEHTRCTKLIPVHDRLRGSRRSNWQRPFPIRCGTSQRALRRVVFAAIAGGHDGFSAPVLGDCSVGVQESLEG